MNRVIVFDTETTGLPLHPRAPLAKQPHIIEFGAAVISAVDGSLLEEYQMMINPGMPIPAEITRITGITDSDVAGAPTFEQALPAIRAAFEGVDMAVAHNLAFDRSMLQYALARMAFSLQGDFPWPTRELCTVEAYEADWGRRPRMKELYAAVLGRPLAQTHRALDDVNALLEIVRHEKLYAASGTPSRFSGEATA